MHFCRRCSSPLDSIDIMEEKVKASGDRIEQEYEELSLLMTKSLYEPRQSDTSVSMLWWRAGDGYLQGFSDAAIRCLEKAKEIAPNDEDIYPTNLEDEITCLDEAIAFLNDPEITKTVKGGLFVYSSRTPELKVGNIIYKINGNDVTANDEFSLPFIDEETELTVLDHTADGYVTKTVKVTDGTYTHALGLAWTYEDE